MTRTASYIPWYAKGGCIFHRVRPTFSLSRSDPDVNEQGSHMYTAINSPDSTVPHPGTGKVIPRRLTRTTCKDLIDKNGYKSRATCKSWFWSWDGPKENCDEYPFASTRPGAHNAGNNFSVLLVGATQSNCRSCPGGLVHERQNPPRGHLHGQGQLA